MLLDYYMSLIEFEPEEAVEYTQHVDELVREVKDKDSSAKLVKAQTLQINYHLRSGNLQKAKALLMQSRA